MKHTILIVDDQAGIRLLLSEVFQSEGFEVREAANGQLALQILREFVPDIMLLDMKMPSMNGLDLLRILHVDNIKVNVMMMTAYGELEMMQEARQLGVLGHFSKPFDIHELLQDLRQLLQGVNNRPL